MKALLILLLASTACMVNTVPVGLDNSAQRFQGSGTSSAAGDTERSSPDTTSPLPPTDANRPGDVSPAPDVVGSLVGQDSSMIGPPTAGGDFNIQYRDQNRPVSFTYGGCVPFKNKVNTPVNFALFREPVVCYVYQDDSCSKLQHPFPVLLPGDVSIVNPVSLGTLVAGSYRCYNFAGFAKGVLGNLGKG